MKKELSFTVKKKREEVFEILTDLKKLAEASQGKVTVTPSADGKEFVIRANLPGIEEFVCRTTEWDPPRRCVRELDVPNLPTKVDLTFEEEGEGTKITLVVELIPQSMMYKMMLPMLEKKVLAEQEKMLKTLETQLDKKG